MAPLTQINKYEYHIYSMKGKNYMINLIHEEKAFDNIQHPFMIKNTQQIGYRRIVP